MEVTRRDFLRLAAMAGLSAGTTRQALADTLTPERLLAFEPLGNVTLLHFTDSHASLLPVYYREPDTVMGVGDERGNPPYLTGEALLQAYGFRPGTLEAHLFTHLDFQELTARYGKMGVRPSGHPGEADPGRAAREVVAPGRRGLLPGIRHRPLEPGRGHAAGEQPARGRCLHRPLGVHLRHRPGEAALRGQGAARPIRRGLHRPQREGRNLGRADLSPVHGAGGRRGEGRDHRPGLPLCFRLPPAATDFRPVLRDRGGPGRGARPGAPGGASGGPGRPPESQRNGRGSQAGGAGGGR
jgi:hypothetical protein